MAITDNIMLSSTIYFRIMFNKEERIGVFSVAKIFVEELNWIFREQPVNDFGIDAFVEITKPSGFKSVEYIPTGRLIGIQIKSGSSFFKESKSEHYIYRGSKTHLRYWLGHSIPVVLILYDKESHVAYWQEVNESTTVSTGKAFKVSIPKTNLLSSKSKDAFKKIGYFKNLHEFKLWDLRSSIDIIQSVIKENHYLYVEIYDCHWRGDYQIRLFLTTEEDFFYATTFPECPGVDYFFYLSKSKSLNEGIKDVLPWADTFYDSVLIWDDRLRKDVIEGSLELDKLESGDENYSREYNEPTLEIACEMTGEYWFRLELKPNDLAFSFLKVDEFLNSEPKVEQRLFL